MARDDFELIGDSDGNALVQVEGHRALDHAPLINRDTVPVDFNVLSCPFVELCPGHCMKE